MNAQVQPTEERALTLAERATSAIAISKTEQELAELAASTASITAITNPAGYQQVHAARMVLKVQRVEIENKGKLARDDANKFAKAVIDAEKKLIGIIEPEEKRLQELQRKWEADREAEKQAKAAAERARIAEIQERIVYLRGNQTLTSLHASTLLAQHLEDLEGLPVDESFAEFQEEAAAAKAAGMERLTQLLNAALAREAEEQRLAEERAQLEREKAEAKRVAEIRRRIEYIHTIGTDRPRASTTMVAALLEEARLILIDDSYEEFREQAQNAKDAAIATLEKIHNERLEHEKEEARLAAERADLERQRQEQEAAAAAERARIEDEERQAKERREAEERAAAQKRAEEQRRLHAEQQALDAEKQRLAEESAEIERKRLAQQESPQEAFRRYFPGGARQALASQPNLEVSGSVNAVEPDQPHGEGHTAAIVESPIDGLETAPAAAQVAETVAPSLTSTIDLFDPRSRPTAPADMPSADEIVFALMTEFGASREQVLEWLASVNWELQR